MSWLLYFFLPLMIVLSGCGHSDTTNSSRLNSVEWEKQIKNPSLTEDEFTRLYARAVGADFTNALVKIVGKRELSVKFVNGNEQKVFLDNAWIEAVNNPADRVEIVRRYLKALDNSFDSGKLNTNSIVPVIRDESYVKQFAELGATTTNSIVSEKLAADLNIVYAIDGDGMITFLREDDRKRLGFDLPVLRKLAIQNLRRLLPELKRAGDGPTFMLVANGDYDSSLLLADGVWENESKSVEGDIVAAVPARDVLIYTGSRSPDGIKKLRQVVAEVQKSNSHLVSNTLLVRRNGRWEKFTE
jgi:uncharacterized protein YtpQ (UPF0354 family)